MTSIVTGAFGYIGKYSEQPANGDTRFSEWLKANRETVGATYSSEWRRHFK
jgi:hypothetical protein